MEIIAIDEKTFKLVKQKFQEFSKRVKSLCEKQKSNIKLKGKILYRQSDIEQMLIGNYFLQTE